MSVIVLDTGALVALERGDRPMWAHVVAASRSRRTVLVPTTALAQAWRGGSGQALLARALAHCDVAPFDPMAHDVGALCGRAATSDICDAHVALVAASRADIVYTSDPDDIRRLLRLVGPRAPTVIRC